MSLTYEEALNLKDGDNLIVNQRLENLKDPLGRDLDFCVKNGDEVIFKGLIYKHQVQESDERKYGMIVALKEDIFNRVPYGEFILTNSQVKFA